MINQSSLKLFGQLILIGGQVVGKIVSSAYKQALSSNRDEINHYLNLIIIFLLFLDVAKNPNISKDAAASVKGVMTVDEASKILNCSKTPSKEELISVKSTRVSSDINPLNFDLEI